MFPNISIGSENEGFLEHVKQSTSTGKNHWNIKDEKSQIFKNIRDDVKVVIYMKTRCHNFFLFLITII